MRASAHNRAALTASIIAAASAYAIVAAALRIRLTSWDGAGWRQVAGAIGLCFADVLLISLLAAMALLLSYSARRKQRLVRTAQLLFLAICLVLTLANCINVRAFEVVGGPLTYQWISFAGDFSSETAREAVKSAVSGEFVLLVCAAVVGQLAISAILSRALAWYGGARLSRLLLPAGIATGLFLLLSVHPWNLPKQERRYAVNPVVELVTTAFASGTSDLLRQRDAVPPEQLPPQVNDVRNLPPELAAAPIRNVVIVVLESVGAKYLGATEMTAPHDALSKYWPFTLNFTNAYAQAAHSTKSLFSLVTGRPPLFSFAQDTEALNGGQFVTLPDRLKSHGYRTAFFVNDLRYAHAGDFLRGRGFDLLAGGNSLGCRGEIDNQCLVNSALDWMGNGGQPFLALIWTHDTHYPYWPKRPPRPGQFSTNLDQNRYIAAVRESESSVAAILEWLHRRGLLSTTLVVVLGDHGEAFGEHGYNLHSNTIYEEELHIPMLLISGSAKGRSIGTLVSISDLPQTILHVLKLGPELSWDSRSFFDPVHAQQLFLFAPQAPAVGFREGDKKYIYDLSTGESQMFDLRRDPGEKINLANPGTGWYVRTRAAGWLQREDRQLASVLEAPSRSSSAKR